MRAALTDTSVLEESVTQLAAESGIKAAVWERFLERLQRLKHHNETMYIHSLRVGWYAHGLGANEDLIDTRIVLFGGCGHDIGKCRISNRLLNAKQLTARGFAKIIPHAELGYHMLKDDFPITAMIAGLHHNLRPGGYGIDMDEAASIWMLDPIKSKIKQAAEVVAIADFYDALITRSNNKGLLQDPTDTTEIKNVLITYFPDSQARIAWLMRQSRLPNRT